MKKWFIIITVLLSILATPVISKTLSQEEKEVAALERFTIKDINRKYSSIEKNIKTRIKTRLFFVLDDLYQMVKDSPKNSDFLSLASDEVKKKFPLTTSDQSEMLIFYVLTDTLRKIEFDIDVMMKKHNDTSHMFNELTWKSYKLYRNLVVVLDDIHTTNPKSISKII